VLHLFLADGAPFAFPPVLGPKTTGTATANAAPVFHALVETTEGFVWPDPSGLARGQSIIPLFPGAPSLPPRNEPLYELLCVIDALRIGSTRVRKIASTLLGERLAGFRA